jgi:hypothetical protein
MKSIACRRIVSIPLSWIYCRFFSVSLNLDLNLDLFRDAREPGEFDGFVTFTRYYLRFYSLHIFLIFFDRVRILCSIPGISILSAMEILLELQDISRFRRAEQLAAYVGLTPSQYSSADKIRMGRITGMGKNTVRSALVESCWHLIRKKIRPCGENANRSRYEQEVSALSWLYLAS